MNSVSAPVAPEPTPIKGSDNPKQHLDGSAGDAVAGANGGSTVPGAVAGAAGVSGDFSAVMNQLTALISQLTAMLGNLGGGVKGGGAPAPAPAPAPLPAPSPKQHAPESPKGGAVAGSNGGGGAVQQGPIKNRRVKQHGAVAGAHDNGRHRGWHKGKNPTQQAPGGSPKQHLPESPKTEAPKTEAPKTEAPKVTPPAVETPKVDTSVGGAKGDTSNPKQDAAPATPAPVVEPPKVDTGVAGANGTSNPKQDANAGAVAGAKGDTSDPKQGTAPATPAPVVTPPVVETPKVDTGVAGANGTSDPKVPVSDPKQDASQGAVAGASGDTAQSDPKGGSVGGATGTTTTQSPADPANFDNSFVTMMSDDVFSNISMRSSEGDTLMIGGTSGVVAFENQATGETRTFSIGWGAGSVTLSDGTKVSWSKMAPGVESDTPGQYTSTLREFQIDSPGTDYDQVISTYDGVNTDKTMLAFSATQLRELITKLEAYEGPADKRLALAPAAK